MSELLFNYTVNGFIYEQGSALDSIKQDLIEFNIYDKTAQTNNFEILNNFTFFYSESLYSDICHPFVISVSPGIEMLKYQVPFVPGKSFVLTGFNKRSNTVVSNLESLEISIVDSQNYGTGGTGAGQYIQSAGPYWS